MRMRVFPVLAVAGLIILQDSRGLGDTTVFAEAAAAAADADGDGMPGNADPMPAVAWTPLYWMVDAVTFRWDVPAGATSGPPAMAAWDAAESLVLFNRAERGAPIGRRAAAGSTAAPLQADAGSATRDAGAPYGLYGVNDVDWLTVQRVRASRLAARHGREPAAGRLEFAILFHNRSGAACRFEGIEIPVDVGGTFIGYAAPVDTNLRRVGFLIPGGAGASDFVVRFVVAVPSERVPEVAGRLRSAAPRIRFSESHGRITLTGADAPLELLQRLREIEARTVAVSVAGGSGERLVWRVARQANGNRPLVGDWVDAVNAAAGGDPFWRDAEGFLLSLNGWDTGAWDRWWRVVTADRQPELADWRRLPLDRDILFELRAEPPAGDTKAVQAAAERSGNPVLRCLAGRLIRDAGDHPGGRASYSAAADAGYAPGQSWLGYCLQDPKCGETNIADSARWFRAAAEQNYGPGAAWYGNSLLRGLGVGRDAPGAIGWLSRAARQGHAEGQMLLGKSVARGIGTAADRTSGIGWLRCSAAQDCIQGQVTLAIESLAGGAERAEYWQAVDWLRCAAEQGDLRSQVLLGRSLIRGEATQADPAAAILWLRKAAEQGDAQAQLELGQAYRAGRGVDRSTAEALSWFRKAAEQGDPEAQTWMAITLIEGKGSRRRAKEAAAWAVRAAERGYAQGQYLAGLYQYAGIGVPRDDAAAAEWFRKAADQGVPMAQVMLGHAYLQGRGVAQDETRAVELFGAAARQGAAAGQIWLSYCYLEGKGVPRDPVRAREWAQAAADQGNAAGKAMLERIPNP